MRKLKSFPKLNKKTMGANMPRRLLGGRAMTSSERTAKWWNSIKSDPVKHEQYKEKRRVKFLDAYNAEKQKLKADEILRKIGLSRTEKYCTGGSDCFCATCKGEI